MLSKITSAYHKGTKLKHNTSGRDYLEPKWSEEIWGIKRVLQFYSNIIIWCEKWD